MGRLLSDQTLYGFPLLDIRSKALSFNKNLVKLLNLISSKGNPYSVWSDNNLIAPVKMQNLMTRTLIDGDIVQRYLHLMENGKKHTEQFIKERFQLKTKKLGHTTASH